MDGIEPPFLVPGKALMAPKPRHRANRSPVNSPKEVLAMAGQAKGKTKQAAGKAKEQAGKATGRAKAAGHTAKGKAQGAAGKARSAAKK
jgi:uncharacterized protein YjbJ (UPF0337 family)